VAGRDWPKAAIVNADDPTAGSFIGVAQEAGARVLTYGTDPAADVRATRVEEDARGLRIAFVAPSGAADLTLRLTGRFNVHNALAAVTVGEMLGLDPAAIRAGLASVEGVPAGWSASTAASRSAS
jgi:UDP-N-acetylmuramyl tripeptide synthase